MRYLYAYQNIAVPANFISIVCCIEIWSDGSLQAVTLLLWVKLFTTALLILYIHLFRSSVVFFFMNLGIGRIKFYLGMMVADFGLFGAMVSTIKIIS